jgi:hypothetical protein
MRRLTIVFVLVVVFCGTACATHSPPVASNPTSKRPSVECPDIAQSGVSAASEQRLASASNVLEYENIWKADHAGATTGTISGAAVRAVVQSKLSQVQACYEMAMDDSGEAGGKVVVRFVIDASGHVSIAHIGSNSFGSADVGCCLLTRVSQWTFPAPTADGFVVVEYPFVVRISHSQ